MHAIALLAAASALFLSASAEPIPKPQLIACPVVTATATLPCDFGDFPLDDTCTRTVTTFQNCGGHGPVCAPAATPTVTTTVQDDCSATDALCANIAVQTECHIF